jgi:hypothetical protein
LVFVGGCGKKLAIQVEIFSRYVAVMLREEIKGRIEVMKTVWYQNQVHFGKEKKE